MVEVQTYPWGTTTLQRNRNILKREFKVGKSIPRKDLTLGT